MGTPKLDTGYGGGGENPKEGIKGVVFEQIRYEAQHLGGGAVMGQLTRDGEPHGMIRCSSRDEFEWLKGKINGVYPKELIEAGIIK